MDHEEILQQTQHRPVQMPSGPWLQQQTWDDLLFMHWSMPPWVLKDKIKPPLELDTFDGKAWLGITPFKMRNFKFRAVPPIPTTESFLETNVRTYVKCGGKPGIHFFSLDASSLLAVLGARTGFLPYFKATMKVKNTAGEIDYQLRRGKGKLHVRYKPVSAVYESNFGSLEEWLTERYYLFQTPVRGVAVETGIHHKKWQLQTAEAEILKNTITVPAGIPLPDEPPLLHFSKHLDVLVWPLKFVTK